METTEEETVIPRNRFIEATKRGIWSWVKFSQFFPFEMNYLFFFCYFSFCHHFFPVCHHLIHVFFIFSYFFLNLHLLFSFSLLVVSLIFLHVFFNIFLYNYWRIRMCVGHTNSSQCSTHPNDDFLFVSACKIYSNPQRRAENYTKAKTKLLISFVLNNQNNNVHRSSCVRSHFSSAPHAIIAFVHLIVSSLNSLSSFHSFFVYSMQCLRGVLGATFEEHS